MAPPLQALISILNLKHAGPKAKLHHITLQIGGSSVSGIADTGSDLIWLPAPTTGNPAAARNPAAAVCSSDPIECRPGDQQCESFFNNVKCCAGHCMFERKYGEGSFARGFMAKRKLAIEEEPDKTQQDLSIGCAVAFGCTEAINPNPVMGMGHASLLKKEAINWKDCRLYNDGGIIGLGQGRMSLLSQLDLKEKKFSFCLPEGTELTTKIKFGDQAAQLIKKAEKVVQLVVVEEHPSMYFVRLTKISMVGTDTCSIGGGRDMLIDSGSTFSKLPEEDVQKGVMLIDSGCTFSKLPTEAFQEVKKCLENVKGLGLSHKEDKWTCFDIPDLPPSMPKMVLHFDTVEMQLPKERYMIRKRSSGAFCIAINIGVNLTLGNFQMRDMAMLFDLTKEPGTLAFQKDNNCKM